MDLRVVVVEAQRNLEAGGSSGLGESQHCSLEFTSSCFTALSLRLIAS